MMLPNRRYMDTELNLSRLGTKQKEESMTLGQERVRLYFNPGGNPLVEEIKRKTAELIDLCNTQRQEPGPEEKQRLFSSAMTDYEKASMWATKAITYEEMP